MSRRHPDRPDGAMGRPPILIRSNPKIANWRPKRGGRWTVRERYLMRRVDELANRKSMSSVQEAWYMAEAIVRCPLCGASFPTRTLRHQTARNHGRFRVMQHALDKHPELSLRERSLLADRAVETMA